MGDIEFEQVVDLALRLSTAEQARLIERLASAMHETLVIDDHAGDQEHIEPAWTDEEIAEMMKIEPMTGAEIVAAGLTGTWADLGITDGAEWVNEQRREGQEKNQW